MTILLLVPLAVVTQLGFFICGCATQGVWTSIVRLPWVFCQRHLAYVNQPFMKFNENSSHIYMFKKFYN
jgi:hypothetical protein